MIIKIFSFFLPLLQPYELPITHFPGTAYGGSVGYRPKQKLTNPITKEISEVSIIFNGQYRSIYISVLPSLSNSYSSIL